MANTKISKKVVGKLRTVKKRRHKKLNYKKSAKIVSHAVKSRLPEQRIALSLKLGHVFPTLKGRRLFRKTVQNVTCTFGFKVDLQKIPIEPHNTFQQVTRALTLCALPGDPTVKPPI